MKRYVISYAPTGTPVTSFTLTATRRGAQTGDRCGDFTLTHTGARGAIHQGAGMSAAECWNK
ncbi:hypothetical protein D3C80_2064390 [compost metagenome]